jgi:hypothetical protein
VIAWRHQLDSAVVGSASTAISATTSATEAITGAVGLITERVDVQDVKTEAASADAPGATLATIATTATAATGTEHRQNSTSRQQLHVLTVDLSKAQYVRHQILLGKVVPATPGPQHLIGGITDLAPHTLPAVMRRGNQ